MATVNKIKDYEIHSVDVFFFDTNVWMYVFGPMAGAKTFQQRYYSQLLRDIGTARASVFVSSLVITEYVNACLQIEFRNWKKKPENVAKTNFKRDFRPTQDYKDALRSVKSQVKDILAVSTQIPDGFNNIDVMPLFDWNDIDFNDAYYMRLCDMVNQNISDIEINMGEVERFFEQYQLEKRNDFFQFQNNVHEHDVLTVKLSNSTNAMIII